MIEHKEAPKLDGKYVLDFDGYVAVGTIEQIFEYISYELNLIVSGYDNTNEHVVELDISDYTSYWKTDLKKITVEL